MRGLRWIATLMCSTTLVLAACSRVPEQPAPMSPETTASASTIPTDQQPSPAEPEAPADSSLSIKRGIVMLAQDRVTFRPCDEKAELWLLDQSDGVMRETFAGEM